MSHKLQFLYGCCIDVLLTHRIEYIVVLIWPSSPGLILGQMRVSVQHTHFQFWMRIRDCSTVDSYE